MDSVIAWKEGKNGYKCSVMAPELSKCIVNYWSKKCTVSIQGKNEGVVKRRIIEMLKNFPVSKRKQKETKPNDILNSIPSTGVDPADLERLTMNTNTHINPHIPVSNDLDVEMLSIAKDVDQLEALDISMP